MLRTVLPSSRSGIREQVRQYWVGNLCKVGTLSLLYLRKCLSGRGYSGLFIRKNWRDFCICMDQVVGSRNSSGNRFVRDTPDKCREYQTFLDSALVLGTVIRC